jgi:hypothetical protein
MERLIADSTHYLLNDLCVQTNNYLFHHVHMTNHRMERTSHGMGILHRTGITYKETIGFMDLPLRFFH